MRHIIIRHPNIWKLLYLYDFLLYYLYFLNFFVEKWLKRLTKYYKIYGPIIDEK